MSHKSSGKESQPRKRPAQGDIQTSKKRQQNGKSRSSTAGAATVTPSMQPNSISAVHSRVGRAIARPKRFDEHPDHILSDQVKSMTPTKEVHYTLIKCQKESVGDGSLDNRLGFVMLESRDATFADVRAAIEEEVDPGDNWRFVVPSLGPVSRKQEECLGPVVSFLQRKFDDQLGDGSIDSPFELSLSFT